MRLLAHGDTGPLPRQATQRQYSTVGRAGSGPVSQRKSPFRDFPDGRLRLNSEALVERLDSWRELECCALIRVGPDLVAQPLNSIAQHKAHSPAFDL